MREKPTYKELEQRVRKLERVIKDRKRTKGSLRDIKEMYHLHFYLAYDVLYSVDTDFRIISISPSVENALGYKPEELIGKTFQDLNLLHPESLGKAVDDTVRILSGEKVSPSVYQFVTKDGVRKFGEVRGVPFKRENRVVAVIAVARDITRRIEMEKSLRESEEKYRIYFSLANDVMFSYDKEFRVLSVSPNVERVLGYKPEELVAKPFQGLGVVDPDYMDKALSNTLRVLSGERIYSSIYKFITKDGVRKFGEVSGVPLIQNGSTAAVISVARDITERIEMEKSLRESEERFRTIFESARDCVFIKNLDLEYEFVNPCMEKLFGLKSDEVIAQKGNDLFGEGSESLTNESDLRVIGGEIIEEEHSKIIDGVLRTFHVIKVPMRDSSGMVTGLCGIARDITERKRFEEELMTKERELAHQAHYLEEMNIALKVLLDSREKEKKQAQEIIISKAQKIIDPYLEKMEAGTLDEENRIYLGIIKSNLQELLSPYVSSVSLQYLNFTPMEMRIADLIKHGRSTKEISSLLNISSFAVSFHRSNIRKKCGLINSRKNLRSYLHGAEQAHRKNH